MKRILVVGQGVAGTLLADAIWRLGAEIQVIDDHWQSAASLSAAGICNPITGRNLVLTWHGHQVMDAVKQRMEMMTDLLGGQYIFKQEMIWLLEHVHELNDWDAKAMVVGYGRYMSLSQKSWLEGHEAVPQKWSVGPIHGAFRVDLPKLLADYRDWLVARGYLLADTVKWQHLEEVSQYATANDFDHIVLCNGASTLLPEIARFIRPNLGVAAIVRLPDLPLQTQIIKRGVTLMPYEDGTYWLSSTNVYKETFDAVSDVVDDLLRKLTVWYSGRVELVAVKTGVRPTVIDRRPILGAVEKTGLVHVFNGLGTKGCTLGAFFSNHLAEHLVLGAPLDKEVDVKRMDKYETF
jgi:glycine/D-amino acid oxidase-like deaminating enzyme